MSPPALLVTMSGPKTASNSTASHITTIASDAHISLTWRRPDQRSLSSTAPVGGCEIVDILHTSFVDPRLALGMSAAHPPRPGSQRRESTQGGGLPKRLGKPARTAIELVFRRTGYSGA